MRPNINAAAIDQERDEVAGFHAGRAFLGRQAGAERLGLSLWILPPGQAAYPYHFHLVEEELLIVLDGRPTLRTPGGTRTLQTGEVVACRAGEQGAHQVVNDSAEDVRFLSISTAGQPEIVVYPDEGKIGVEDPEHERGGAGPVNHCFRRTDAVGFYDGIEPR